MTPTPWSSRTTGESALGETRAGALAEERGIPTAMGDGMEERGHVDRAKEMRRPAIHR